MLSILSQGDLLLHTYSNWNLNECGSFHGNGNLTSVFRVTDVSVAVLMSADQKNARSIAARG